MRCRCCPSPHPYLDPTRLNTYPPSWALRVLFNGNYLGVLVNPKPSTLQDAVALAFKSFRRRFTQFFHSVYAARSCRNRGSGISSVTWVTYVCVYVRTYVCMHVYVNTYVCSYVHMYVYISIHKYTHIYAHICIYIYIKLHTIIYIIVHIHACLKSFL